MFSRNTVNCNSETSGGSVIHRSNVTMWLPPETSAIVAQHYSEGDWSCILTGNQPSSGGIGMSEPNRNTKPALKATDEDLLEALERVIETLDAPAVPTGQVAAELPIERQTVKRRLDDLAEDGNVASLATGQGRIWWLPEGEGGYVDPAALEHSVEQIDPYDVPRPLAREIAEKRLPEFQPPETVWERMRAWGTGRADDVVALIGIGVLLLLLPSTEVFSSQLSDIGIGVGPIDLVGFLFVLVALLLAIAAGSSRVVGVLGERATARGYLDER